MAISNKIKQLYDAIKSDGGDVGTEDEFNDWFLRPGEEGYNNRKRVYDTFKSDGADVGANYEEFRDWLGLRPADAGAAASTAAPSAPTQQQPSALPGVVSRDIDAPMEIERRDIIADAIDENERLQKDEMAKKAADIDAGRGWDDTKGVWDNFVRIVGGGANESVGSAAPKANVTEHDENMRNLVAERQVLEETRKRRDAGRLKKSEGVLNGTFDLKNNARNIGKGVKDVVTDADFLLNGVIGMQKGDQLIKIDEKIGRGEELTDSELRLVNAALLQGKVESETTVPHGYTAGQTLAEMAPFMAQMALNPANGAASTMAKAAAKQSIKRFGKKAARRIATGVTIAGEVGESAVLANTLQATSTASDIKSRYIGKAYVDENGQIAFDGSKDWSDAIYRGEGAAIIENYTELLGSHFGLMKDGAGELVKTGVTKLGGGKLVNQVSDLVTRIGSTKWAQAIGNIEKRANWNGSIGEMLEEEAGIVLNSMFVGDNKISDLVDPEQQIDIALGVGLFGGFVSGIKTAGYPVARYNARRNLNRADVRASELMGDKWDGLRNSIDDAEEGDLSSIVASVIAEEGMTGQKQRAVVDYARALMTSRGYNISSESVREDGMASAEEVGAVDSFDAGYSITDSQEMVDARLEMERQRVKLVSSMSEDIADEFDADPLDALARTYDPEIREIASKYVNAKMVYDGMIQRVRDDIDGRIAQSDAMIDGRVNRDTGMIQGATLTEGKEVYVVNGNVAMLDDGVNVDVENSDESLIVRDAEGRLEFVAPSQVQSLLAPVDAASEKEAAAEAIRNEIAQSAADKIDGVLHFAPNDVYAVINEDGTQESLTIVGESVDASGVAVDGMVDVMREDGSVVAMNTADIQRMVDESNARRLDERDKARESAEADSGVEAAGAAAEEPRPSALSRIPTDQNGEPLYEQVDADTAWDAFVEQSEGDEEIAREVVADILAEKRKALADAEKALKSIGDSKPNASNGEGAITIQERIAAKMASKRALTDARDAVERAKGVVEHWQSIGDTMKRRAEAAAAERRRQAEIAAEEARQAAERERADAEEAERLKREALNGVPDWGYDTAADARARGYRRAGAEKVDRPEIIDSHAIGKEVDVKFSDRDIVKGRVAIIDAGELQPSHIQGDRNPAHFLDEAQPKERNDAASVVSAQKIASNIRPEEITSSVTAYTGAPTVNSRGEVIQGNSRSDALRLMYESQRESAQRYRQYLVDHAADFGLTPEQIVSMESPVLVNVVDVDDNEAIRLGQFVAQDTESGGIERIKPKNAVTRMGSDIRGFAEILLRSADDDASFSQLVAANGADALAWMSQRGYISPTQYNSALDSKGNLTGEAANDLKGILYQSIFQGGSTRLEEMFNKLPAKAQKAILATAYRDHDSNSADRMTGELQQSILAFNDISSFPGFAEATNLKDAMAVVEVWKNQYVMDDVTGDSYLPTEKFSNFALHLVAMYRGGSQRFIQGTLNNLFDVVQGVKEDTLFEESDKVPKSLAEAIRIVLDLDYQPINNKKNGYNGSNAMGVGTPHGEEGGRGSAGDAPNGEREPGSPEPTDSGRGAKGDSGGRGNLGRGGAIQATAPQAESRSEKALTREEAAALIAVMEENAVADPNISLSPESWQQSFGLNNSIDTPLGKVKMGEGQYAKLVEKKRSAEFGMVVQTLKDPDVVLIEPSTAKDGQITQRDYSYVFVKTFIRDGRKVKYYTSVSVLKDGLEVSVSSHIANKTSILKKLESMERAYTKESLLPNSSEWHLAEHPTDVPDLLPTQGKSETNEEVYNRHTTAKQPAEAVEESPNPAQSDTQELASMNSPTLLEGKVSENFTDKQAGSEKSSVGVQIAAAEAQVNTDPTPAQKEAGNYKKGHVQVGAFDVTIENPKGSKRSGTDADGKKWETTMTHTYGYIRGTKGVDSDHIDVYLSSDIDGWDGRNVFVVDQYNPDGTFDEHKVMLGFNSEEDAYNAYLSNYESEWEKGRRLDVGVVDIREFEKWVDSSRRKTKAFSEYRSVKSKNDNSLSGRSLSVKDSNTKGQDNQGNPIDHTGKLIVEDVKSVDEITDDDFNNPTRTIGLPTLPGKVSDAIGGEGRKPIVKRNILNKNKNSHKDLTPADSRKILNEVLYNPDLYGQNQKAQRPYNWILVHLADKNSSVILEVNPTKEHLEIVNWHYLNGRQLEQKKRQAEREGGRILTLSDNNAAGDASQGLSSDSKDNALSSDKQANNKKSSYGNGVETEGTFLGEKEYIERMVENAFNKRKDKSQTREEWEDEDEYISTYNRIADSYVDYISGLKERGELQRMYDAASLGDRIKIRNGVATAGFEAHELIDFEKERQQARRKREERKAERTKAIMSKIGISTDATKVAEPEQNTAGATDGDAKFSVGSEVKGDADVYNAAKGLVESTGIEVVEVSGEEAQAMMEQKNTPFAGLPNRANEKQPSGSVFLSINGNSSSNRADSKEYEAKLQNRTLSAKNKIAKFKNGDYLVNTGSLFGAIKDLGKLLAMDTKGGSRYTIMRTDKGDTVAIRLSDHRANGNNFGRDATDRNLSIVIERKRYDVPDSGIEFTEAVIPQSVFESRPEEVVSAIVNGVEAVLADKPFTLDSSIGTVEEIGQNVGQAHLLHTPSGVVYGWTVGGKVYLNRDAMNPEAPIHEYTHLWDEMVRKENPQLWERGKELMKQTPLWNEIVADSNYADIRDDEDAVASEVHARLTGSAGARLLSGMIDTAKGKGAMATAEAVNVVDSLKRWLTEMLDALKATLGKWSKRNLDELTIEDFNNLTLRDIAEGVNPQEGELSDTRFHAAMSRGREDFDAVLERAIAERGIVTPGLNGKEIRVVDVPRYDFTGTGKQAIEKARLWADSNLIGNNDYHRGQQDGFTYVIDRTTLEKYLSSSSTKGSDNLGVHLAALKMLPEIINESIEAEIHADYVKGNGKRSASNGVGNPDILIHRMFGAVTIDGVLYRVKTTIKEDRNERVTPYNYQVTELELLISGSETSDALSNSNLISAANLLQGVEKSYDPGKKLLEESRLSDVSEADDVRYRSDDVADRIERLFDDAVAGNLKGKPIEIGRLTEEGKKYLEDLSGIEMKEIVSFVLNPSDLVHVYRNHFNGNEKDLGNNIPLLKEDIRAIANVLAKPERVLYGEEPDGLRRKMFYFLSSAPDSGAYNLLEIHGDRKGNLTAKTFYKTKKAVSQRVLSLMKSEHLTSVTDGASLSDANLPNFFELPTDDGYENLERSGDGSYSDAEVSMENDPWSKAWGETLRSKREQRAFAERERERMRERVESLSELLGIKIDIVEDGSTLEGRKRNAKGWYDTRTGKITVVIGNHKSTADIEATVLHEAVAHHGLRELLGEHFDEFLDKVYELADNSIKERIALLASRNGWNRRIATEEYLAGLAEDTDFENAKVYNGWWGKIKRLFLDMLSAVGFKHIGVELSDNELRYILWRSYKNMVEPGRFRAFEWEAEDVAMKYNLKAGEYAESSPVTEQRVAEAGEVYELNDRFNNELNRQIAGDLPQGHVYDMGMPSEYLLSTGIARLPIRLSAKILNTKSNLERHAYDLETLRNLVYAIQKPWAIFSYGDRSKAQNMIIGIEDNGRQFLVGISINPTIKGRVLEINSIRNVFPKNNHEWVNWINEGKLLRVDGKKEIQDIIAKLRMNPVAFDYVDLDNAAKIVENFKNPTIREQNNNAGESVDDGVRYRMGDFTPRDRKIAADVYDKMVSSARFEFSEAMQDSEEGKKYLTAKSFFKSKEGVSQRAMLLHEYSTPTFVTDGATLFNDTKIPNFLIFRLI